VLFIGGVLSVAGVIEAQSAGMGQHPLQPTGPPLVRVS
jgi:hypothetical protein